MAQDNDPSSIGNIATIPVDSEPGAGPPIGDAGTQLESVAFDARYSVGRTLGEGGMGTVLACHDRVIGREVATKLMLPALAKSSEALGRFLREARVQGQLEHPSVVPVHDLAIREDGSVFFTMKRVRGRSLDEILDDRDAFESMGLRRLLEAFGRVCLVVDFAHRRRVVHRDLKPANIMLGDYGEVYVLDWGIAKAGVEDATLTLDPNDIAFDNDAIETQAGALVGTPGYIAPEAIAIGADDVDGRVDVFALGAILYELLTGTQMYTAETAGEVLRKTLEAQPVPPSERAPDRDVPPELETIWERATTFNAEERYATARDMYREVEAYLDGELDLELRRAAAARHAESARSSISGREGPAQSDHALRELGRALTLDPANVEAQQLLKQVLARSSEGLPHEAREELTREQAMRTRLMGRLGVVAYGTVLAMGAVVTWMGISNWPLFVVGGSFLVVAFVLCFASARFQKPKPRVQHTIAVCGAISFAILSRLFGPAFLVPGILMLHVLALSLVSEPHIQRAYLIITMVALLTPFCLEWVGVLSPLYSFDGSSMTIRSGIVQFPPLATSVFLPLAAMAQVLMASLFVRHTRRLLDDAEVRLRVQAWQLRKLVPDAAAAAMPHSTAAR